MMLNPERIAARRRRRQLEARIMQGVMAGSLGVLIDDQRGNAHAVAQRRIVLWR